MTDSWDEQQYSQFLDARTRPERDLLFAIPTSFHPQRVYDLGCGPGNSTRLLKERWPDASLVGLDSSVNMLDKAKSAYPDISFIQADIAHFLPEEKADCLFANASLHWLDKHEILIPKLLESLNARGILAIQMPNNFHSPSHQTIIEILQETSAWQHCLKHLIYGRLVQPLYHLPWYYHLLIQSGMTSLQLWETEYYQEMPDYQSLFNWLKGTVLRSVLSSMDDENQSRFMQAYLNIIETKYPLQKNNRILFPFRRIFIVGIKNSI